MSNTKKFITLSSVTVLVAAVGLLGLGYSTTHRDISQVQAKGTTSDTILRTNSASKIQATSADASSSTSGSSKLSHAEIVAQVEARFSDLKKSDKVLPVDGGYLYGEADESNVINGAPDTKHAKHFNSKNDVKTITVAKAEEIEIKNAENGISSGSSTLSATNGASSLTASGNSTNGNISNLTLNMLPNSIKVSPMFTSMPYKSWALNVTDATYVSGNFAGKGWQFAGYLFYDAQTFGTSITRFAQNWQVYGDSARIGDWTDAYNTEQTGVAHGTQLNPSNSFTSIWPTDGSQELTFFSYYPASGSGYRVRNGSY